MLVGGVRMPRVEDSGGARFHIDGCYEKLLTHGSRWRRGPLLEQHLLDPRIELRDVSQADRDVCDWLRAERRWRAERDRAERLAAGEPFEVPRMYFGGHTIPRDDSWPAWLRPYSDVKQVRVYSDDTIEPAEYI
jgi:hypothetical protein